MVFSSFTISICGTLPHKIRAKCVYYNESVSSIHKARVFVGAGEKKATEINHRCLRLPGLPSHQSFSSCVPS